MALIHCPECGKEISDKSEKCIHCGYPIKIEQEGQIEDAETGDTEDGDEEEDEKPPVLTKCPVCGKIVSSSAYECPECGHPLREKEGGISFGLVLLAVILGIVICAFF